MRKRISISLTEDEEKVIRERAKNLKLSISGFIKSFMFSYSKKIMKLKKNNAH